MDRIRARVVCDMKGFYIIALLIVGGLALAPYMLLPTRADEQIEGRIVSYSTYGSKVRSMDPATSGDTTSTSFQAEIFEGLYAYHYLKRPVEVIPQLAAAMPVVSDDKLTYTIRLKEGVLYQRNPCFGFDVDGRPATRTVRAEDFVLTFKRVADYHITTHLAYPLISGRIVGLDEYRNRTRSFAPGDFTRYDLPLEGVRAVDEHTLEIRLTEVFPQIQYVLAMHLYAPTPREAIDYHLATKEGPDGSRVPIPPSDRIPVFHEAESAVGTGPYMLAEWVQGARIVLERNPEFRPDSYPTEGAPGDAEAGLLDDAGKPVPFIDRREFIYVEESTPAWMLFITKQVGAAGIPRDVFESVILPSKDLSDRWKNLGIRLLISGSPAIYWYAFNMEDPILGNSPSLRRALSLAYDVPEHIDVLYNGRGMPAVTYVPHGFEAFEEAGPSPYARYDLDEARALMVKARQELEAAGVLEPGEEIPPLTLDMWSTDESSRRMAEFAQGQFEKIGVKLLVELNDWPTLQVKVHKKQCQLYTMGWHADYPDPETFLQIYYGPNIAKGTNNTNYANPDFDRLYEQAAQMMPSPQRTELYVEMLRILNEDCPVLLLSEPITFSLFNGWVYNSKPHPFGYGYGKYRRIDVAQRKAMGGR